MERKIDQLAKEKKKKYYILYCGMKEKEKSTLDLFQAVPALLQIIEIKNSLHISLNHQLSPYRVSLQSV